MPVVGVAVIVYVEIAVGDTAGDQVRSADVVDPTALRPRGAPGRAVSRLALRPGLQPATLCAMTVTV